MFLITTKKLNRFPIFKEVGLPLNGMGTINFINLRISSMILLVNSSEYPLFSSSSFSTTLGTSWNSWGIYSLDINFWLLSTPYCFLSQYVVNCQFIEFVDVRLLLTLRKLSLPCFGSKFQVFAAICKLVFVTSTVQGCRHLLQLMYKCWLKGFCYEL